MLTLSTGITICAVPTGDIPHAWSLVQPFVRRALNQGFGEYEPEHVLLALHCGEAQLWLVVDELKAIQGIAITELQTYPGRKICNLWLVAGTGLEQWEDGLGHIESWAMEHDCNGLVATCRPGAARKAERLGFKTLRHQVFKPLLKNQQ